MYRRTHRVVPLDAHYVARLERGAIRWPGREYRGRVRRGARRRPPPAARVLPARPRPLRREPAVAAALDGQVDRALAATREALTVAVETGSAHIVADLRRMRRALDRWTAEFDAAPYEAGADGR